MPAKNVIKPYVADSFYHVYNRGVNKQPIFFDKQDYSVFLSYLKAYLLPKDTHKLQLILLSLDTTLEEKDQARKLLRMNNFFEKIELHCFILMPNHFHFLLHQKDEKDIDAFMQSLMIRYSGFISRKYKRVGHLFQDRYKAVLIETEDQLLYLTRYIHRNALEWLGIESLYSQPSSYPYYLGQQKASWIKPDIILSFFSKSGFNSYQEFVESKNTGVDEESQYILSNLTLDH